MLSDFLSEWKKRRKVREKEGITRIEREQEIPAHLLILPLATRSRARRRYIRSCIQLKPDVHRLFMVVPTHAEGT
jgi:hypothetical protein